MQIEKTIKTYDNYKASGIEWIGEIPHGWQLSKYKFFARSGMGETILSEQLVEQGIPVYSATQEDKIFGFVTSSNIILKKDDLVIPARGNSIGCATYIKDNQATCTQTTIYSKLNNIVNKFLYYCCLGLKDIWFEFDDTAIPQITVKQVQNNPLPLPCKLEQQQIADYLDKKCGDIDRFVEVQKNVIEKLKEYKQSVITEAVTKGLDKSAPLKDSGIEWIGKIPEHWKVIRLKYKFHIKKEIAGKEGYDILSVTQKGLKIKDISTNEGQLAMDYSKYQLVTPSDFVMNHMDLLTGWVDCSVYGGVTSPDYRVFVNTDLQNCNNEYYKNIFQTCYRNKIFFGIGQGVSDLGRWRLQSDKFLNFYIPIPPYKEQIEINECILKKCFEIDKTISDKEKLIEKLTEYKKSLIYECVTGKRKVVV